MNYQQEITNCIKTSLSKYESNIFEDLCTLFKTCIEKPCNNISELKKQLGEKETLLAKAKKDNNQPNVELYQLQVNDLNSEINKANFSQLKTDTAKNATEALRNTFIQTVNRTKERIQQVLTQETVSALGCSQEQNYETNKSLYIKIPKISYLRLTNQRLS